MDMATHDVSGIFLNRWSRLYSFFHTDHIKIALRLPMPFHLRVFFDVVSAFIYLCCKLCES